MCPRKLQETYKSWSPKVFEFSRTHLGPLSRTTTLWGAVAIAAGITATNLITVVLVQIALA